MSKEEIKYEINKVLDHFSDEALGELLNFLKELDMEKSISPSFTSQLEKIIHEDKHLLERLAK